MAFAGRRVLAAGGTGTVGSGLVQTLLGQGAKVVVPTRSKDKFEALKASLPDAVKGNVSLILADVTTEDGVKKILDDSKKDGGVQHVVASIGSWWQKGRLAEQSLQEFNEVVKVVASHFLLFRAFQPYLNAQAGSTYTLIAGNAGFQYLEQGTSLLCMRSGAINGLGVAARAEYKDCQVAVGEVMITCFVHPKLDKDLPQSDNHNVGHDLIGSAIAATITARSREQVRIADRQAAKALIK